MKKLKLNKQYLTIAIYAVGVVIAAFLFGMILFNLGDIFDFLGRALDAIKALPYGILIALILYPFLNLTTHLYSKLLERKKPHPRLVSILSLVTVYLGAFLVIAIILLSIIPPMIGTITELFTLVGEALVSSEAAFRNLMAGSEFLSGLGDTIISFAKESFQKLMETDVAGVATSILSGFVGETFDILVGVIISLYLLSGRRMIGAITGKIVAAVLPSGGAHRTAMFIKRLYSNFTEFIAARILSALFLGTASFLLFWVFKVPFYPLLALLIAVLNLFPVFGTILSMLICGIVLLITRPAFVLPVLGILIGLELIDNLIIEPRTIQHKPLRPNVGVALVLLLVGYAVAGVTGALMAIPVFATVQNALRSFSVHLLNRRGLPTRLEDYENFNVRDYIVTPERVATDPVSPEETAAEVSAQDGDAAQEATDPASDADPAE